MTLEAVLLSVASWLAGFFLALQRDKLMRRRQARKIAGTLMAEVQRLREELGPRRLLAAKNHSG
jgi:hypothetical protein